MTTLTRVRFFYRFLNKTLIFLLSAGGLYTISGCSPSKNWVAYYSDQLPPREFTQYEFVIFHPARHPTIQPVKAAGTKVFGYVSLGEVQTFLPIHETLKAEGAIAKENPNWGEVAMVDIRSRTWQNYVLETLVKQAENQGFDGFFLDTIDSPIELERAEPEKYKGSREAAIALVEEIHRRYPKKLIVVNRAFPILENLAPSINMVLAESILTNYEFSKKTYCNKLKTEYGAHADFLQKLKKNWPHLRVLTLDYWDPDDRETIDAIYQIQREHGFDPLVATIHLDKVL